MEWNYNKRRGILFYRRNRLNAPRQPLAYSISGTPSTVRTTSKSSGSTKQMLPSTRTMSSQLLYRDNNKHNTKYTMLQIF